MTAQKVSLIRRLERRVRSELGVPYPWVTKSFLGKDLIVREGTLIETPDYDDAWLYACLKNSKTMFDVGANVGQWSLVALSCAQVKQVVLVEANWKALAVAADNLIRNNLSAKARFVGAFAAEKSDASINFWTVGTGAASSMFQGHAVTAAKAGSMTTVPTVSLDDLCSGFELCPDLIKIDVEGAEAKVLTGATKLASRNQSRFFIEMHSPPELPMTENAALVLAWAKSHDYAAWYLSEGVRIETPDPIAHRGRCHLLVQPSSWPYPEWLRGIKQSANIQG